MQVEYVRAKDVKPGDVLITDGGFTCMAEGVEKVVQRDPDGSYYVACDCGQHYLAGQLGCTKHTRGRYVGLTKKAA